MGNRTQLPARGNLATHLADPVSARASRRAREAQEEAWLTERIYATSANLFEKRLKEHYPDLENPQSPLCRLIERLSGAFDNFLLGEGNTQLWENPAKRLYLVSGAAAMLGMEEAA